MRKPCREAMVGNLSLYDCDGNRQHTLYLGEAPEYGAKQVSKNVTSMKSVDSKNTTPMHFILVLLTVQRITGHFWSNIQIGNYLISIMSQNI